MVFEKDFRIFLLIYVCSWRLERVSRVLQLEFQVVVRHWCGSWEQNLVPLMNSALNHGTLLSAPASEIERREKSFLRYRRGRTQNILGLLFTWMFPYLKGCMHYSSWLCVKQEEKGDSQVLVSQAVKILVSESGTLWQRWWQVVRLCMCVCVLCGHLHLHK